MTANALLLGCGSIGGMVDLNSDRVASWAKAFSFRPSMRLDVHDRDPANAAAVGSRYGFDILPEIPWSEMPRYQLVIVATPTPTHAPILTRLLESGPTLVVCEKPVAATLAELDSLEALYRAQSRRVLVNFHRRFQPGMVRLSQRIADLLRSERCTNIAVRYQRGIHNNASHAMDLLQYLFDRQMDLGGACILASHHEEFSDDPTMTVASQWHDVPVLWQGLTGLRASVLDIDLYFERTSFHLTDGGDMLVERHAAATDRPPYPLAAERHRQDGLLAEPMLHVLDHILAMLQSPAIPDNFLDSINISRQLLALEKV